jgi:hypothetical protein
MKLKRKKKGIALWLPPEVNQKMGYITRVKISKITVEYKP